ncbi:MAG: MBL fold metallo-hydrolase [Thermoleophilia bacterium]
MLVTLLGTAGWIPGERRETTSFAVRDGDNLLLFDAGTGLRRLLEPAQAALLEGALQVHLFLTHYHLDHVCGLAYLPGVLPDRPITIHAPGAALTGVEPEAALAGLLRRPYNPRDWRELAELRLVPLAAGVNEVAGHEVRVRPQQHSDVSVAYRVDDAFVLATDTGIDAGTAELAAGAGLLLHEAWYNAADPRTEDVPAALRPGFAAHSEAGAVAGLAAAAGVGRLVLIHLNPLYDEAYYSAMADRAGAVFARTEVRADGAVIETTATA